MPNAVVDKPHSTIEMKNITTLRLNTIPEVHKMATLDTQTPFDFVQLSGQLEIQEIEVNTAKQLNFVNIFFQCMYQ